MAGAATYGNLYVTFTADAPVFFYGSVVDNVNGDAIYVPATSCRTPPRSLPSFVSSSAPVPPGANFFRRGDPQ